MKSTTVEVEVMDHCFCSLEEKITETFVGR